MSTDETADAPARRASTSTLPARGHRTSRLQDREDDLAAVDAAVDLSFGATGTMIVVTGPLGAGRSALLDECARRAGGRAVRVLRARATHAEREFAFGVARQLLGGTRPDAGGRAGAPGGHAEFESLYDGLCELTAETPVLLLVDDVSWCDPDSARWLAYVGHRLRGLALTMVLAAADGDDGGSEGCVTELLGQARTVRALSPLTPDGTAVLARSRLGDRADAALVEALADVCEGNPLFLDAILAEIDPDPSHPAERHVRECSPVRLRNRLTVTVRRMPDAVRRYLTAVQVIGDVADERMLGLLAGLDGTDMADAHRAASRAGLVRSGRRPRLRHRVVADALDAVRSAEERRRTHLRAAELLHDAGVSTDRVAAHLMAVTGPASAWMIDALRGAATLAARRGERRTAVDYLRHAVLCEVAPADRAAVLVELATLERGVDAGLALRRIVQAVPLLTSATARADALCRATPMALEGVAPSVIAMMRGVAGELAAVENPDGPTRELALRLEARLHYAGKDSEAGLADAAARLDELERRPGGLRLRTPGERELVSVLVYAAAVSGRWSAARVASVCRAVLALEPSSSQHVHSAVGLVVPCLCMADAIEDLPAWLSVAVDHARSEQTPLTEAVVRAELAAVLVCSGRTPQAAEQARLAYDLVDDLVDDPLLPGLLLAPVLTALDGGDSIERTLARYGSASSVPGGFGACLQLLRARVASDADDPEAALEYCLDAGRRFERIGWDGAPVPWRPWAVELRRGLGRFAEARALAEQELARTRRWGAPTPLGRALRLLGELSEPDRAGPLLTEAVEVLRAAGDGTELVRAQASLDAFRDRAEDPVPVAPPPQGPSGPRLPRTRSINDLTRAERRVAVQAARGCTNQEIAGELRISVRAVEKHLTGVYRKLGVSGRSGLGRIWHDGTDLPA